MLFLIINYQLSTINYQLSTYSVGMSLFTLREPYNA